MATALEIADYKAYATRMADQYNVPRDLFLWQIQAESGWDPVAKNPTPGSTATGLGQFTSATAKTFNIDPTNPYQSLEAAAKYDAQLYSSKGSWTEALKAYGTTAAGLQIPADVLASAQAQGTGTVAGNITAGISDIAGRAGAGITKWIPSFAIIIIGVIFIVLAILMTDAGKNVATKVAAAAA